LSVVYGQGLGHVGGFLPARRWVHLAQTWDRQRLRLFVDGRLTCVQTTHDLMPVVKTPFRMADAPTPLPADSPPRFRGRIASVRVYNRALTREEILEEVRSTNVTGSVIPSPIPRPGLGRVQVEVDAARLGRPLDGVSVTVAVLPKGSGKGHAWAVAVVQQFDRLGRAVVDLDVPRLKRGEYVVRATAKKAGGQALGVPGEEPLPWPGSARFPAGPEGAKKLNNLVTELLHVPGPDDSGAERTFVNPRTGWIYISNRHSKPVQLTVPGTAKPTPVALSRDYGETNEALRYLPQGTYRLTVPVARDLTVHAVPELIYDVTPGLPHIAEFGPYEGEFESRCVFPHANAMITWAPDRPAAAKLKNQGRRLYDNLTQGGAATVEEAYERIIRGAGFTHPLMDGYVIDEFAGGSEDTSLWAQAMDRALSAPQCAGKTIHAYSYDLFGLARTDQGHELLDVLKKHGHAVLWECYMDQQRTEPEAWRYLNDRLVGLPRVCEEQYPGFIDRLIVVFYSYVSAGPPWLTNTWPGTDSRAWLDLQMQTVATHPAFANVPGLMVYRSHYADEEMVRWAARLFRHYGIEGQTGRLEEDPCALTHLQNPDFEEEGVGWTLEPAEAGTIRFGLAHQFGVMEGRYEGTGRNWGDAVLITRRSDRGPNRFSQEIRGLEPGHLYSFCMVSAYHTEEWKKEKHAVTIQFDGATLLPEKCFTSLAPVGEASPRPGHLNYHYRVFRAEGRTATLTVSDWAGEQEPGGPVGQELMYNYMKIQPYWSE
jgi:hypothetical protein